MLASRPRRIGCYTAAMLPVFIGGIAIIYGIGGEEISSSTSPVNTFPAFGRTFRAQDRWRGWTTYRTHH
ncbi:hypothetical protein AM571_PC00261 (plasmid) [Rhizobium etli 8C-3]|uniref:Uncharacterized protein n=1 Tax=Rhizobium etli 8C-3 TaxID=538025 RepID=A0A1L5PCS5_RHIET|nr:hypothetical protein AM571_PC00261 [Rhizobium etli 8C-3]